MTTPQQAFQQVANNQQQQQQQQNNLINNLVNGINNAGNNNGNNNSWNINDPFGINNNGRNNNNNNNGNNFNFPRFGSTNEANPTAVMARIFNQYDPKNEHCRFQSVSYNLIKPNMNPNIYQKPVKFRSQLWEQGVQNNPDPKRLYPVGIRGYDGDDGLNVRAKMCFAAHAKCTHELEQKEKEIRNMKMDIEVNMKIAIKDMKQTQRDLSHRLLAVLRGYACRIASGGYGADGMALGLNQNASNLPMAFGTSLHCPCPLSEREVELKRALDAMGSHCRELMTVHGRIKMMWAQLGQSKAMVNPNVIVSNEIENPDPKNMKKMFKYLKDQQSFIHLLASTVQSDMKDLAIIREGSGR